MLFKERLPLKLEAMLERVNAMGFAVDTLHVMSAFRTPFYNHAIGDVQYSMHQWGSAADIYVDPQKTGSNGRSEPRRPGRHPGLEVALRRDRADARREGAARRFQGGMGFYPATAAHPPFVHVDVRGTAARWKG